MARVRTRKKDSPVVVDVDVLPGEGLDDQPDGEAVLPLPQQEEHPRGRGRPPGVRNGEGTTEQIVLQKLTTKHKQIISLALQGESRDVVAEACGCTPQYVSFLLRQPLAKQWIEEVNAYLDVKLVGMYTKSLDAIDRGLDSKDRRVALEAAKLQMTATGKAQPSKDAQRTAEDVVMNILNVGGTVRVGT